MPSIRGILTPAQLNSEVPVNLFPVVNASYINEFPLVQRLRRVGVASNSFDIITRSPRARTYTLGAAITTAGATTITVSDASAFMQGDVIAVGAERVEVNGAITVTNAGTGAGTLVVVRGAEGTTATDSTASASTHGNGSTIRLIGNSRTGAEVDQDGYRPVRVPITQHVQTYQVPVQVGGRANALAAALPPGIGESRTPGGTGVMSAEEEDRLRDMLRDAESTALLGIGESGATAASGRWKQKGLRTLANLGGNLTASPTNASTYAAYDFERDLLAKLAGKGGYADVLVLSTDFGLGFTRWANGKLQLQAGESQYGTQVNSWVTALFPRVSVWFSAAMPAFSACALDSSKVKLRVLREESYKPRASRGDAYEGDWLMDFAIDPEDPALSVAWVEGVTAFAA